MPRARRPHDPEERRRLLASFDRCVFDVRGISDLPDGLGLRYGDRVEVRLLATVVRERSGVERDGEEEHVVTLDPYDGRVVGILDELVPRKRRRRRVVARTAQDGGDAGPSPDAVGTP